jgi:hypothetical protein
MLRTRSGGMEERAVKAPTAEGKFPVFSTTRSTQHHADVVTVIAGTRY